MIVRRPGILLTLMLTACSSDFSSAPPDYVAPSPPTEQIIATSVSGVAAAAKLVGPLQVSDVRPADHGGPGGYFVCIRETNPPPDKRPHYYAIFFDNDTYKGDRQSVIMDQCETQTFRPLPAPAPQPKPAKPGRKRP
jgi:hypothetical protein